MDPLRRAAEKHQAARDALERAIRAASAEGQSLRSIAESVGWSHEQVRRTVKKR